LDKKAVNEVVDSLKEETATIGDPKIKKIFTLLFDLVELLASENEKLTFKNQQLKNEVNELKGEQGKPDVKPNKRKIKAMGIKMVLSGEGADEIFGGYLYFHKAPNAQEFHEELNRKLDRLHKFDCLRANKSMSAWGIEARVPFLDKHFMDVAMRINPEDKMCGNGKMEKAILRESFEGYLPKEILWRQKEQFSDGVGYSWIDGLKAHVEALVTDQQLENAHIRFPVNTPDNKEGYYYRTIFEEKYPLVTAADCVMGGKSVACSTQEALAWDESFQNNADPSGRAVLSVHNESY
jgi:asparagine synthase (glutamine-hydrolysing)